MNIEISAGFNKRKAALRNTITEIKTHDGSVKKKLAISAGLGTAVFGTTWIGIPAFALRESSLVEGLTNSALKAGLALGLSYGINMASLFVNLNQSRRLLKNEKIETCPNFPATVIHHSLGRVESLKEQRNKRSIAAISAPTIPSMIYDLTRDSGLLFVASLSPERMHEVVLFKSAQAAFYLTQSAVAEVVLRTKGREKKKTQVDLPPTGAIVEIDT